MKVSKALEEVWRWKDEVAQETKGMTVSQQFAYFRQAGDRFAKKNRPETGSATQERGKGSRPTVAAGYASA